MRTLILELIGLLCMLIMIMLLILIVRYLFLLLKGVNETVQNEVNEQKGGFLSMLLSTLGAFLLGNLLTGRGINREGKGNGIIRASEGIVRAGYGNNGMDF